VLTRTDEFRLPTGVRFVGLLELKLNKAYKRSALQTASVVATSAGELIAQWLSQQAGRRTG